jgi:cysteinyl-tRNA synthetase
MDFVLWKPSGEGLPGWDSPWGRGRPGWHIECSAMADALLGESFDIHGGGNDLMFPHHENEIAQSCCAHPGKGFARIWMHNEMLQVEGKKMSKSLGNFFTVRDLLDQGIPGEVIRFVFLSTHYGKPMDWTQTKANEALQTLREWAARAEETGAEPDSKVIEALADDLNTALAFARLHELFSQGEYGALNASASVLGFDLIAMKHAEWALPFEQRQLVQGLDYIGSTGVVGWGRLPQPLVDEVMALVRRWLVARWERNWEKADRLRAQASDIGLMLQAEKGADGAISGTAVIQADFDPSKLEELA